MSDLTTFLSGPVGRAATVIVLGDVDAELCDALITAAGGTGLVVIAAPEPPAACPGAARLRATVPSPVLSHVADVVLLTSAAEHDEPDLVAEEARRLLAPGGVLRAVAPREAGYRLLGELHAAAFRDVELVQLPGTAGIRARGPR